MTRQAYRLAPFFVGFLIIVWLATDLAQLTWALAGAPPRLRAGGPRQIIASQAAAPTVDIDAILAFAPFGTPAPTGVAASTPGAVGGNFILEGVVLAADPESSQAIIAVKGAKPKSYLPGEALPGGGVLFRVKADAVILRIAGRDEILKFPPPIRSGENIGVLNGIAAGPQTTQKQTPIDEVIVRARERIAQNPKALLDDLGVQAGHGGYLIGAGASAMTRRAGFKPGDLVTRVNGVAVGDIEGDRRLFEDVVESGSARVEIVRDGKVILLTFPLR